MKCTEIKPKLLTDLQKAGFADERGIAFMAGCSISHSQGKPLSWADRVISLSGDKLQIIYIEGGFFGYKIGSKTPICASLDIGKHITGGNVSANRSDTYTINIDDSFGFKEGRLVFDIEGGTIPAVDKMIKEIGATPAK